LGVQITDNHDDDDVRYYVYDNDISVLWHTESVLLKLLRSLASFSNPNVLVAISKGVWAVKLCFNKTLSS